MKYLIVALPLLVVSCSSTPSEPVDVAALPVDQVTVKMDSPSYAGSRFALDSRDARVVRLVFAGSQPQNGGQVEVKREGKPDAPGLSVVDFGKDKFYVYQDLDVHGLDIGNEDKEVLYGVFSRYTTNFIEP